ncbi:hypothetical protein [Mollivirus kamchatka]|nr:hypothetical protein [Mollivirus kamchatka]
MSQRPTVPISTKPSRAAMTGKVQLEDLDGVAERMSALTVSQAIPIPRRQLKPVYDVAASGANEEEDDATSASEGETEPEDGDDLDDEHFDDRGRKVDALGRCIDSEEDEDDDEDDDYDIKDPFINDEEDDEGDEVPALLSCSEEDETCESGDETDNDDEVQDEDSDEEAEEDD